MTDGEMAPNMGNLSFQGYEWKDKRVGATSDSDADRAAQQPLPPALRKGEGQEYHRLGGRVRRDAQRPAHQNAPRRARRYQANNASQLNDHFQAIARQISKLRLSE